jgi:hypothetical protein
MALVFTLAICAVVLGAMALQALVSIVEAVAGRQPTR